MCAGLVGLHRVYYFKIKKENFLTRSTGDRRTDWHELVVCRTSFWEVPAFFWHPLRVHSCTAPSSDVCSEDQPCWAATPGNSNSRVVLELSRGARRRF
jgi:hypothetical protein